MNYPDLALKIKNALDSRGQEFISFQKSSPYQCPPNCGKCCLNPEITCSPFELLPLALELLSKGVAEEMLVRAKNNMNNVCVLVNVQDESRGLATCSEYEFRPLICRAFGVSGRTNKKNEIALSICKILKDLKPNIQFSTEDLVVPNIGECNLALEVIDPIFTRPQVKINEALVEVLEKVLMWDNYTKSQEP